MGKLHLVLHNSTNTSNYTPPSSTLLIIKLSVTIIAKPISHCTATSTDAPNPALGTERNQDEPTWAMTLQSTRLRRFGIFLASVGGAMLVVLLVQDIPKWCRDNLFERRIEKTRVNALVAYQVFLKMEESLREEILGERREYEKAKTNAWSLFVHKGERVDQEEKAIEKGKEEVKQMRADLEKEKGEVEILKADVEKGLEELRKIRAKIIEKADEVAGSSNRVKDMDRKNRELEQ
ncbi:uncharacterized protein CLUP02_13436 [Colletotrichum lupini]|uniref:Uncharacterized protein n=1 Tax=Colletotrichum lupini TaxID=145971 RepID=A0A9Q8T2P0_9PEZI|nr:uncharacterized protein CLUP02_13436 [Colletotrichum lupini]KAK1701820.1 hypothetical protein BDP67DRAFT_497393 [Colletotrichum lupini]UQC87915.1 hypothetical protein CLUP02_13436 [Colletotrichum lupini]